MGKILKLLGWFILYALLSFPLGQFLAIGRFRPSIPGRFVPRWCESIAAVVCLWGLGLLIAALMGAVLAGIAYYLGRKGRYFPLLLLGLWLVLNASLLISSF